MPYIEFVPALLEKATKDHIPLSGSMELTERCNNQCVHCYINRPVGDRTAKDRELTFRQVCHIIDQIVDEGCLWLLLTGGEVLIRPDFLDIYGYAKRKGLLLTIFANGTLLTPRVVDYLAEWPPFNLEITLYGISQEVYERVSGVPGSFARCMKGIELALDRNLPLKLKTMVFTSNRHELEAMKRFADDLGVKFRFDPLLNAPIDQAKSVGRFRLSPSEVVDLDFSDPGRASQWLEVHSKYSGSPINPENLFYCKAGLNSFHVDAYGRLSICMMMRHPSYDLKRGTFAAGWHEFIPELRMRTRLKQIACQDCDLINLCEQCPAWSQLEYGIGHEEDIVDYVCQVAHLRMQKISNVIQCGQY